MTEIQISAVISVHNEEAQLADCLEGLRFADEIVVLLDKCSDKSGEIARKFTKRVIEDSWTIEGDRRNVIRKVVVHGAGHAACLLGVRVDPIHSRSAQG